MGEHIKVLIKKVWQSNNITFMEMEGKGVWMRMYIEPE